MTETAARTAPEEDTHRAANRKIVEQYMNTKGQDRAGLQRLFTEDGAWGLWTTDTGEPVVASGQPGLGQHAAWSLFCFPDLDWTNVQIFETQDPDWFWVECDAEGTIVFPGYPEGHYRNHFIQSFRFQDGKIHELREFTNPCVQLRALGIEVPGVKREGLPG
jgi:ketosteroid isomerase-like protein